MNWTEVVLLIALAWAVVLLIKGRIKKHNIQTQPTTTEFDMVGLREIYEKSVQAIEEGNLYLQKNLKVSDLAQYTRTSDKLVSRSINHFGKGNFNLIINRYRVNHAKEMMSSGKFNHYTIEAIADECGFSNKVSFYNAFKSQEGMAPKEYWALKQLKKD